MSNETKSEMEIRTETSTRKIAEAIATRFYRLQASSLADKLETRARDQIAKLRKAKREVYELEREIEQIAIDLQKPR